MEGVFARPQPADAADTIRSAEALLAHQNSAVAQIDLQVVSAILNAHLQTVQGRDALDTLQQDIQAVVRTRTDLDTPSGARDLQRFLIGKLRDIRTVVADTGLDDTSKSALMAAWTSLYDSSRTDGTDQSGARPTAVAPSSTDDPLSLSDAEMDPGLDSLFGDDPDLMPTDAAPQGGAAAMPMPPTFPGIPNLGGGAIPGSIPALGMPGGTSLPGWSQESGQAREPDPIDDVPDDLLPQEDRGAAEADHEESDDDEPAPAADAAPPSGPTTVTLPNGETVTAASPQLAAAIKAAAGGTPIPDAFRQQGITIPPPGTAVAGPIDAARVAPGDIGMFTDRHALALGNSKALLNGQIQHISTVKGPSFLGWEHPPAPQSVAAPAGTEAPVPTRPAAW